ncbi:MAG: hypothetical protein AAB582_03520 [Patescibacteria group bacterium]
MTNDTKSRKREPQEVRECLSRDVHSILSVCLHQFKDQQEIEETCFNVDAVISGRSLAPKIRYEQKIAPISWSRGATPIGTNRPYAIAEKGSFIPSAHFSPRFA